MSHLVSHVLGYELPDLPEAQVQAMAFGVAAGAVAYLVMRWVVRDRHGDH